MFVFIITIIQFLTSLSNSSDFLINIRFFRLKIKFVECDYYNSQRFINHIYNREIIMISITISEYKVNNLIYVNIKNFIEYMKLNVISHDKRALKIAKKKLLNKYYKFYHI